MGHYCSTEGALSSLGLSECGPFVEVADGGLAIGWRKVVCGDEFEPDALEVSQNGNQLEVRLVDTDSKYCDEPYKCNPAGSSDNNIISDVWTCVDMPDGEYEVTVICAVNGLFMPPCPYIGFCGSTQTFKVCVGC